MERLQARLFSLGSNPSFRRNFMLKARLVLVIVIAAVILLTAGATWKISLKATDDSFDKMSAQLREDVAVGAVKELKNLLDRMSVAASALYVSLGGLYTDYSWETMSGPVLPPLWGVFNTYKDMTTVMVLSGVGCYAGYRRNGPEQAVLRSSEAVALPPPKNDSIAVLYMYVPDPATGDPLTQGPSGKVCAERCPVPWAGSGYFPGIGSTLTNPIWLVGRRMPKNVFYWSVAVDNGFQPYLFVAGALKDTSGATSAVMSVTSISSKLQNMTQSTTLVRDYGGRMFITLGRAMNMVTASNGTLFLPMPFPAPPRFVPATNSSDLVIREASIYINCTYGDRMHTESIKAVVHISGSGPHYINSVPLQHQGLQLVVFLVVPRREMWGGIEHSRDFGLALCMGLGVVMAIVGALAMCLSTLWLSSVLTAKGIQLDEASAANEALEIRLAALAHEESLLWPQVDMGTPLEKLTTIMKCLKPGDVLSLPQQHHMLALVTSDDLHRPHFLDDMDMASSDGGGSDNKRFTPRHRVDRETSRWIRLLATGRWPSLDVRRYRRNPPPGPAAAGQSVHGGKAPRVESSEEAATVESSLQDTDGGSGEGMENMGICESDGRGRLSDRADSEKALVRHLTSPPATSSSWTTPRGPLVAQAASPSLAGKSQSVEACVPKPSVRLCRQGAPCMDYGAVERLHAVAALAAAAPPGDALAAEAVGLQDASLTHTCSAQAGRSPTDLLGGGREPSPGELTDVEGTSDCPVCRQVAALGEPLQQQVALLGKVGYWDFDTLALAHASPTRAVPLVGFTVFTRLGLIQEFGLHKSKLANFLQEIGSRMQPQPYHNAAHVADVSASLCHLLRDSGVGGYLQPLDKLAVVCAALVHDYKHPGVNNDFLSRTRDELATIYNDESPLENFHLAEAFQLLYCNEHCNFLEGLSERDFCELRRLVIDVVLATDLKHHFGILDQFKTRASQDVPWDPTKESDRTLLLQVALKVADIGHAAKPLPHHQLWSQQVIEEFYNQGDAERKAGLKISPFMDRIDNNVPKSQGFSSSWFSPCLRPG
eukprot:jgi/Mesvir1/3428/Mv11926-RA.2